MNKKQKEETQELYLDRKYEKYSAHVKPCELLEAVRVISSQAEKSEGSETIERQPRLNLVEYT